MQTVIGIADELIDATNIAWERWSYRKNTVNPKLPGGHYPRIRRAAVNRARIALAKLGFTPEQITQHIKDADEQAELERNAVAE